MTTSFHRLGAGLASLTCAALLAGSAFAAAPANPSPAPPPGMHAGHGEHGPQHLFDKLGLSADQKARVDAVFQSKGTQVKDLHEKMRANMDKLHQAKPDDPNYAALVSQVAQDNGALTTQAISAMGDMHAQLYAVLTPAQRKQFEQMQTKMHERMKEHGWRRGPRGHGEGPPMMGPMGGDGASEGSPPAEAPQ